MITLPPEARQRLIDDDLLGSRLLRQRQRQSQPSPQLSRLQRLRNRQVQVNGNGTVPVLAPGVPSFAPGVQVLMSTYQRPALLKECLASIEEGMRGLGLSWQLLVGIDGPHKETQAVLEAHKSGAARFVWIPFAKASSVAAAKNRVLGMAMADKIRFPWMLFMDDDDYFRRERITHLLASAVKYGHTFAVGNYEQQQMTPPGLPLPGKVRAADVIGQHLCGFPPQSTVLHASILPVDGHLFDEDVQVWEDVTAWRRLRWEGHHLAVFDTPPVYTGRINSGISASRPITDGTELQKIYDANSVLGLRRYPPKSDVASICTVCVSDRCQREVRLMLTTLRSIGKINLPVYVICDPESEAVIHSWNLGEVRTFPLITEAWLEDAKGKFRSLNLNPWQEIRLPSEIMAAKQRAILTTLKDFPNTLYLDGDNVILGDMSGDQLDIPGTDACFSGHHGSWQWNIHVTGWWQAGVCFANNPDFIDDWVKNFWLDTTFGDQSVLNHIVPNWRIGPLPPGYNVGPWCFTIDYPECQLGLLKPPGEVEATWFPMKAFAWEQPCHEYEKHIGWVTGNSGVFWNGTRVRTAHCHMWPGDSIPPNLAWRYNENLRLAILRYFTHAKEQHLKDLLPLCAPP
jgi:hypothetical protein